MGSPVLISLGRTGRLRWMLLVPVPPVEDENEGGEQIQVDVTSENDQRFLGHLPTGFVKIIHRRSLPTV